MWAITLPALIATCLAWFLYVGYFKSYIDHEEHEVYFVKKFPTFRQKFVNPFANEGDRPPVEQLSKQVQEELADYCKYRYGFTNPDNRSLEECKNKIEKEL